MKTKIFILTGPQGGGKTHTINRIEKHEKLNERVACFDGVNSIEEFDDIIMKEALVSRVVLATNNDTLIEHLNVKNKPITFIECDYKRGKIPSIALMLLS